MTILLAIVAVIAALFFGLLAWGASIVSGLASRDSGEFNSHDAHAWVFLVLCILFAMLAGWVLG